MAIIYRTLRKIINTSKIFAHLLALAEWMAVTQTVTLALHALTSRALVGCCKRASKVLQAGACKTIRDIIIKCRSTSSILAVEILSRRIEAENWLAICWNILRSFLLRNSKQLNACISILSANSLSASEGSLRTQTCLGEWTVLLPISATSVCTKYLTQRVNLTMRCIPQNWVNHLRTVHYGQTQTKSCRINTSACDTSKGRNRWTCNIDQVTSVGFCNCSLWIMTLSYRGYTLTS
jgi:hypothetical protein